MGKVTVRYWPASDTNGQTGHIALFTRSGGKYGTGHYISFYPKTDMIKGGAIIAEKIAFGSHNGVFMPRSYDDEHGGEKDKFIDITFRNLSRRKINKVFEKIATLPATKKEYDALCQEGKPLYPKKKIKWDYLAVNLLDNNNASHNCSSMTLSFLGIAGIGKYVAHTELNQLVATLVADDALAKKLILFLNAAYESPKIIDGYQKGRQSVNPTIADIRGQVMGALTGQAAGSTVGAVGGEVLRYTEEKLTCITDSMTRFGTSLWSAATGGGTATAGKRTKAKDGAAASVSATATCAITTAAKAHASTVVASAVARGCSALTAALFTGPLGLGAAGTFITIGITLYTAKKSYDLLSNVGREIGKQACAAFAPEIARQIVGIENAIPPMVKATQNIENRTGILSPPSVARLAMMAECIERKINGKKPKKYPEPTPTFQLKKH